MKIAIIGGGASGLACAILLARGGNRPVLFEKSDRVGKKLLATGNGRCNLTNRDLAPHHFHSVEEGEVATMTGRFTLEDSIAFFKSLGVDVVEESRGKIYPITLNASTVLNAMRSELAYLGVEERVSEKVTSFTREKDTYLINGTYEFDRVILATGGKSQAKLGSDGSGYTLAESLGHSVSEMFPGICAITLNSSYLRHLKGSKVVGRIGLYDGERLLQEEEGEYLFTQDGISGPPVFDLARKVNATERTLTLRFPLVNHLEQMERDFAEELESRSYLDRSLEHFLQGIVSKNWIHVLTKEMNLSPKTSTMDLSFEDRMKLLDFLFSFPMVVTGTRGFDQSQVTCGGLRLSEFNSDTLESYISPGFYALGEVLDLDGDCGGYNLQWAWTSAYICANAIQNINLGG